MVKRCYPIHRYITCSILKHYIVCFMLPIGTFDKVLLTQWQGFFNMSHPRLFLIYFRSFETVQILERNRRSRDSNSQPLDLSPLPSPLDQCSQNNRFTFDCVSEFIKLPKLQGRGIGCGSVGWAVASNARGPWFEYSIQSSANFYIETFVCC